MAHDRGLGAPGQGPRGSSALPLRRAPDPGLRQSEHPRVRLFFSGRFRPPRRAAWHRAASGCLPRHGRWLHRAEPELSVLTRQALSPRRATQDAVYAQVTAWVERQRALTGSSAPPMPASASRNCTLQWKHDNGSATADRVRTAVSELWPNRRRITAFSPTAGRCP